MGQHQVRQLAKIITYILLHRPDECGLFPDADGSLPVKEVLWALHEESGWGYVRPSHLRELCYSGMPLDFTVDDRHIRPKIEPKFQLVPATPPPQLFYAARRRAYPVNLKHGLRPGARSYVSLAVTEEMALRIGRRRDARPVLITVQAAKAHEDAQPFFRCGELLYLVKELPARFLHGPPLPAAPKLSKSPGKKPAEAREPPGSFLLDPSRNPLAAGKRRDMKEDKRKGRLRREKRRRKRGDLM